MLQHVDIVLSFAVVMLLLSLVVTTVVQIVVAVLWQRYFILRRGIARLIQQAVPTLQKRQALKIAKAVLCHPAVSKGLACTTAIRKDELIRLMDDLAEDGKRKLSGALHHTLTGIMKEDASSEFAAAMGDLKNEVKVNLMKALPEETDRIGEIVDRTLADTRKTVADLGAWFDTVVDRTTDQFIRRTRVFTIICAVLLAFSLHIDSLKILRQLRADPNVRAKLIENVDATLQRAEDAFALSGRMAMASAAIRVACEDVNAAGQDVNTASIRAINGSIPLDLVTRNDGIRWIKSTVHNPNECNRLLATYEKRFDEKTRVWLLDLRQSADAIRTDLTDLNRTTLAILPDPFPGGAEYVSAYLHDGVHLGGTVMTAVFLSLGAPFWYNALKQLSSLRPAIAQKVEHKPAEG